MATIYSRSLDDAEVVEVEFLTAQGFSQRRTLLVDTGFTGRSSVILSDDSWPFIRAEMRPAEASGALQGTQQRAWVTCRIPEIGFQQTLIAILTDLAPLSLPEGVQGMVGLRFLRHFTRWGAEQSADGWRFFLSYGSD